jgi:hypothetical protein
MCIHHRDVYTSIQPRVGHAQEVATVGNELGSVGLAAIGVVGVVIALARTRPRRQQTPDPSDARLDEIARQLAALQQSVDAVAIEVERVGEGLRFTTKMLAQGVDAHERS